MNLAFSFDSRGLNPLFDGGVERALFKALKKAGGDASRSMRVGSSREVRARKRLKVRRVNEGLPLSFPIGTTLDDLVWRMRVSGDPVRVVDLPHRQVKRGVSAAINTGKRVLIKSAFVARMKSGHVGIFRRRGDSRLPIDEAFTTRISDVFKNEGMIGAQLSKASTVFGAAFDRLLPLELAKLR